MSSSTPSPHADIGIVTVIPVELRAVLHALGIAEGDRHKDERSGTVAYLGSVRSFRGALHRVAVACVAGAGNPGAAGLTTELVRAFGPSRMLLVGIAAGMRGKVKIGEVVFAERIVAYEPTAVVEKEGGGREEQRRPEIVEVPHTVQQDVASYEMDGGRLLARWSALGWEIPRDEGWKDRVVTAIDVKRGVTIASGEKLLRDPAKLREVRADIHGKVKAGDMEAHGFAKACAQQGVPWLVIRGISDFGDSFKDDRFHDLAARTAAVAMVDFLERGLDLGAGFHAGGGISGQTTASAGPSPFVWGRPIDRDEDFIGRTSERQNIEEAIRKKLAVQILGGARTGRSSLLRWFERHPPGEGAVVRLSPGEGLTPMTFVATIAERLGSASSAESLRRKGATWLQATETLRNLPPFVLLLDDAHKLASTGKGFELGFFEALRAQVENKRLAWISVSTRDLYEIFDERGLGSGFLNSSEKIWLGQLDENAAAQIAGRAGPALSARMLAEAGHFAYGLQWLGDRLHREPENADAVFDAFSDEMQRAFRAWWALLSSPEQKWLKQCVEQPVPVDGLQRDVRGVLNRLVNKKHVAVCNGAYHVVPGDAWARFVRDAH